MNAPGAEAHRFFFALKPDADMAAHTLDFARAVLDAAQDGRGLLNAAHHHVTLALTADQATPDPALIAALRRAGDRVQAVPFALHLDRLVATNHSVSLRPSVPVPALTALQSAISAAMAQEGVPMRADWHFDPHETLAYRKSVPGERIVAGFHWPVRAFMLVHSHVGLHRHETIGAWPLAPG